MQCLLKQTLAIIAIATLATLPIAQAEVSAPSGSYSVDPDHGYVNLMYNHLGYSKPNIRITGFDADLTLDANALENSKVTVEIDAAALDSGVKEFDEHLRGEKFFDVAKYPKINFSSTSVKGNGDGTLSITGDLTAKGVTKPVTLEAKLNKAGVNPMKKVAVLGFSAETTIKRSEWELGEHVPMIGDDVTIYIETEFLQDK